MKKKILSGFLVLALSLAACGKPAEPTPQQPADAGPSPGTSTSTNTVTSTTTGTELNASIANPLTEVSLDEMAAATGLSLKAPEGASDVAYYVLDSGGEKTAQMSFIWQGKPFICRAQATLELEAYDMTGLYYSWTEEKNVQVSYCPAKLQLCDRAAGLYWLDVVPGINYSLGCDSPSSEAEMLKVAGLVFEPLQGDMDGEEPGAVS